MISDVDLVRDQLDQEETEARRAMDALVTVATFWPGTRVQMPVDVVLDRLPPEVRSHVARWDPWRVLDEVAVKRGMLDQYEQTVRQRDEAQQRAAGASPGWRDVLAWKRAQRDVAMLEPGVRRLAEMYRRRQARVAGMKRVTGE
ncbi:DUF6221 family protein [Nonomuraea angiospora]|uniref:DUF6221 family protein n=1 Tax=Nonomuraea angiospora TaxID=46172 RepID=UPI00344EBD03